MGGDASFDSRSIETKRDMSYFSCGDLVYCEYYNHCRQSPCSDPRTNFQKNHDFGLKLPILPNQHYIVQYRSPYPAIISRYKLEVEVFGTVEDSARNWATYLEKKFEYNKKFHQKWLSREDNPLLHKLKYEDLIANPFDEMRKVLSICNPRESVQERRLREVIERLDVEPKNSASSFKYYSVRDAERLNSEIV
jgi:hypothetical protein